MKIIAESTLTCKEQLTVPKVVRQLLDLHAGDSLVWSLDAAGRLVVSGGRTNTLEDIRAAVAAAEKTDGKPGGTSKTLARVTIKDVKAGIARAVRIKHGRVDTNDLHSIKLPPGCGMRSFHSSGCCTARQAPLLEDRGGNAQSWLLQ